MGKSKAKPAAKNLPTTPARSQPPPARARMTAPAGAVRIRMYRQGLGDCFLLAFPTADPGEPFYLMIDCGVILGTEKPGEIMTVVAEDIRAATGGRIDVVVGTHEHWDHLSGFLQAREVFEGMEFGEVWLAWTENPADKVADALRKERVKLTKALHLAAATLDRQPGLTDRVRGLIEFFGVGPAATSQDLAAVGLGAAAAAGKGNGTDAAFEFLKDHAKRVRYFRPGQKPVALAGVAGGARAFVLGPPRDEKNLFHSDPSAKEKAGKVVYSLARSIGLNTAFLAAAVDPAALGDDPDLADLRATELARPFDACYHVHAASVDDSGRKAPADTISKRTGCNASKAERAFFRGHYYDTAGADGGGGEDAGWRRIDGEWLEAAAELALKLDNDTNNTSLALAIELPNGNVLLFPADAQVGNWTSWNDHTFDAGNGQKVTAKDLLARTVFYKVGHHGSHNATLRVGGLEDMGGDLVAMLPVDQAMAAKKRWGHMPLAGLVTALKKHTGGRLLRLDSGPPADGDRQATLTAKAWKEFRAATKTSNHLYLEYVCPCA